MAKVLISMPDDFLNKIDNYAASEQRTRSELIREALRTYLRKNIPINRDLDIKNAQILEDLLD
jgi:metal-responsive CopG/Arc/MetJ family transcriptional regulator